MLTTIAYSLALMLSPQVIVVSVYPGIERMQPCHVLGHRKTGMALEGVKNVAKEGYKGNKIT
jgi:hypothetical protein